MFFFFKLSKFSPKSRNKIDELLLMNPIFVNLVLISNIYITIAEFNLIIEPVHLHTYIHTLLYIVDAVTSSF